MVKRLRRLLSPIPWRLVRKGRLTHRTHDRYLLEEVIFPALRSRSDMQEILFIGCESYTADYPRRFADRDFMTMDVDPAKAKYGAAKHLTDNFANVAAHFDPQSLDAVICNGVIGWGLDRPDEIHQAMRGSFMCLRPGGMLVLGWNDMEPWRPPPLEEIEGLKRFSPLTLAPFPTPVYPTLGIAMHVFNFYVRPDADG